MEDYSKLKSIELINFMGFVKAKAIFDESGSLNLKGYNSSGKSAFLTACAVAMMNAFPQKQAKYIRHGENYFRIVLSFSDGVVIVRDKYKNGQSLYEMYKGEKKIYTSKQGDKLSKVDAVPEIIENYLALISTDIGYLNYQVRRDPLWLIDTKGSENYYTLNEVLKSVEIAEANALLNADKNALNGEITIVESDLNSIMAQLSGIGNIGEELLSRLYERRDLVSQLWGRYDALNNLYRVLNELENTVVYPEVEKLNSERVIKVKKIKEILDELEGIKYFDAEISKVDYERALKVAKLKDIIREMSTMQYFETEIQGIEGFEKVSDLERISGVVNQLSEAVKEVSRLKADFESLEDERSSIMSEAEKKGIFFTVCSNCGTLLEVSKNG